MASASMEDAKIDCEDEERGLPKSTLPLVVIELEANTLLDAFSFEGRDGLLEENTTGALSRRSSFLCRCFSFSSQSFLTFAF